jgi:hypothetical protein
MNVWDIQTQRATQTVAFSSEPTGASTAHRTCRADVRGASRNAQSRTCLRTRWMMMVMSGTDRGRAKGSGSRRGSLRNGRQLSAL